MSLLSDFRRVVELVKTQGWRYPVGIASLGVVNISDVLAPVFMALAVELTQAEFTGDPVNTPTPLALLGITPDTFTIITAVAVFLVLQVLANIARYPMLMQVAVPSHEITQLIRRRIANLLLAQSQSWYDKSRSGDIMSIATSDVQAVRMMLGPGVLIAADTLLLVSLVLLMLSILSWELTLITLIPVPFILLITNKLSHLEFDRFKDVQEDLADMTERARESYAGIRIIQGYAREVYDRRRFAGFSERHFGKNLRLARVRSFFEPTLDLMLGVSTALVVIFGGIGVAKGTMTLGTFVAFLFLIRYLSGPMIGLGWSVSLFQRGRASMHRIDQLCETELEITNAPNAKTAAGPGGLKVQNLTFRYTADRVLEDGTVQKAPKHPVLRDISFEIPAGKTLGVFGPVGSGKSSLACVLTRLYDPPAGTVFLDGEDIRELTLESLREMVVLAPQETFLFSSTVARNIVMTRDDLIERPDQGQDEVVRVARLAHLHDEVEHFEDGYQTMLGERGVNLSGGQRQRLAIARAITADPKVLILDDCLSAVDTKTESAILQNLRTVLDGRTGLVISHRVRAVQDADEIIVIEDGQITQRGTHDELLAQNGYYARIAAEQSQAKGEAA